MIKQQMILVKANILTLQQWTSKVYTDITK